MTGLAAPRTPRPEHTMRRQNISPGSSLVDTNDSVELNGRSGSPVCDSGAMTPPPSTQLPKPSSKPLSAKPPSKREHSLASPPATLKASPPLSSGDLFGEIPSLEAVRTMNEEQLRGLITELLPAFGEAKVNAAHSRLQHSLLSIETGEAAKRAAVEQEATRREVQVLQEGSPVYRHSFSPRSPQASMQRNLQLALSHCRDLQHENATLGRRLRSSKKIIAQLDEQNADLKESIHLLRQRIKDNRDHLNEMQSNGVLSINSTPVLENNTPMHDRTPKTPVTIGRLPLDPCQTAGSQDPFDALLLAGQVMNGEASSVPSSPLQARAKKIHPQHMRGAHSLSSLPTTPNRSRPITAQGLINSVSHLDNHGVFSAPSAQLVYHEEPHSREDRESTISASDDEDDSYRVDLPGSQASQMATSMLRRSLGPQSESNLTSGHTPESSRLMQAKLFGQVSKAGLGAAKVSKRVASGSPRDEITRSIKKARIGKPEAQKIGLGIKT